MRLEARAEQGESSLRSAHPTHRKLAAPLLRSHEVLNVIVGPEDRCQRKQATCKESGFQSEEENETSEENIEEQEEEKGRRS